MAPYCPLLKHDIRIIYIYINVTNPFELVPQKQDVLSCYLGLLLVPSSQELHDYNVRLGHLQYTVNL